MNPGRPAPATCSATIAARVAGYAVNDNADLGGVLGKYAKLVSSASHGAIT